MELTSRAQRIFDEIKTHCKHEMGFKEIDNYGLEMLAIAFDTYQQCQEIIEKEGMTQMAIKTGFLVVRPEVGIQKNAVEIIAKFSDRFGLNPDSRKKIFGKVEQKKKKGFDLNGINPKPFLNEESR